MMKRNVQILFRLDKKEAQRLNKQVRKSGLSREAYLRHLIDGVVPPETPPADYYSMMSQLHGIGKNLNQIAQKAHAINAIDAQRYDEEMYKLRQVIQDITRAVLLPKPLSDSICSESEPHSI